ncbi:MAG: hypothetical protein ACR2FF_01410 [Mycobacteriales bacterium]|nr:MAG: hypothetical protein DLM56_00935 [Pseudonocardiales bacterium]
MTDLLGNELTDAETALLQVYRALHELVARGDLPPCALAGARHALAYLAQPVNDLGLEFEHTLDVGV